MSGVREREPVLPVLGFHKVYGGVFMDNGAHRRAGAYAHRSVIVSFDGRNRHSIGAVRVWSIGDEFYATLLLVSYLVFRIARILNVLNG